MRETLRTLVLLHADATFRERLRRVTRGRFNFRRLEGWQELERSARETGSAGIIVVDPYHGQARRGGMAPEVVSLLRRFPSAAVVAALSARPGWLEDVRTLGDLGLTGVIDMDTDTSELLILRVLNAARARPLREFIRSGLRTTPTGRARMILDAAADAVISGRRVRDLAVEFHIHRDTLLRWCHHAGIPTPRELMMWLRVLLAAELLDNPGQTVEHVAYACGYSSDDALARALYRRLGMRPAELRRRGGFTAAAAIFQAELDRIRRPSSSGSDDSIAEKAA
ncbi:MAG: helix-turn-helix domain-containing protein [Gemmatimonadota bacterium]|nr:helix-turn-helix domain-containing protein [Gemmatimonadota bacterium]